MEGTPPARVSSQTLNILCGMCKCYFNSNDDIYTIGCGHLFHQNCLNIRLRQHPECPQCGSHWNGPQQRIFLAFEEPSRADDECLPYKWVPMQLGPEAATQLPHGVVQCGTDDEGNEAYVARVIKDRELLPASYVPTKQAALASTCQGAYWLTKDVEVLVLENCYPKWVVGLCGRYPLDALETGFSDTGEITYTGRVFFKRILRIGKVHPSYGAIFVAHKQQERVLEHYEVLVITRQKSIEHANPSLGEPSSVNEKNNAYKWMRLDVEPNPLPSSNQLPPGVVQCGTDDEGHTAYVARVVKDQELLPASYVPDKKAALASTFHRAYWFSENVEVLVVENSDHKWVDAQCGSYPAGALKTGYSDSGEITYTGCCYFRGILRIGKVHPSITTMFVAHRAREKRVSQYKVLVLTPHNRSSEPLNT